MNQKVITLKEKEDTDIFTIWVKILSPFIKTSDKEQELLAAILRKRHKLMQKVNDPELLNTILFSTETRAEIREELGYSTIGFTNILAYLKKRGLISKDNKITNHVIPDIDFSGKRFTFTVNVDYYERKRS